MTLPQSLIGIFKNRQSSYKMVLVLTLLEEMDHTGKASLKNIVTRFQAFYKQRVEQGLAPEKPRLEMNAWEQMSFSQIRNLILSAPFKYLNTVLEKQDGLEERIGFRPEVWTQMTNQDIEELRAYAEQSLQEYYGDVLMNGSFGYYIHQVMSNYLEAKRQLFAGHSLGNLVRRTLPSLLQELPFISDIYKIQGSVGQGNWANIPWIAIMDKRVTETTQQGEYVVYLFSEDMRSVYLTLAQGVTVPLREKGKREGYEYLIRKVQEMRNLLPLNNLQKDDQIYLTQGGLGQDYQVSTVAYIRYDRDNLPSDEELITDLENIIENYKIYVEWISGKENTSNEPESQFVNTSSDFYVYGNENNMTVAEQIEHIKNFINQKGFSYPELLIENFFLSLKTKPFVLLAGISGTGKTRLVKLFAEAVGATENNDQFTLIPVRPDWSDPSDLLGYTDLSGTFRPGRLTEVLLKASKPENQDKPYFICLDEMNLARVEHYFSDVLSILETQRWEGQHIVTDKIIQNNSLSEEGKKIYGDLRIPENVYMIGTVNMDETTHPFSKKVLDRANTLEFNFIDLNDLPRLDSSKVEPIKIGQPSFRNDYLFLQEAYPEYSSLIQTTTEKLVKINQILEEIHAHVGFRVRDTICFFMIYNERFGLMGENQAFDLQLTQKILPRIQGSSSAVKRTLIELMKYTTNQNFNIEEMMADASPLYDQWRKPNQLSDVLYPKSSRKIAFMLRRFEEDGFTSFWLS